MRTACFTKECPNFEVFCMNVNSSIYFADKNSYSNFACTMKNRILSVSISRKFTNIENLTYTDCGMIKITKSKTNFPSRQALANLNGWSPRLGCGHVVSRPMTRESSQIKIPACDLQYKMEDHPNHIGFVEDRHNCAKEKRKGEFSIESILLAKSTTSKSIV